MFKKSLVLGASFAALMAAGLATPAFAATATTTATPTDVEAVTVTGSFIAGTPEDAAMPVEATTLEEIRNQGSPSNMDLIKGLSEIGGVAGEANRNNAFAIGSQSVNLRSLGSSRTVVLFNGRRFPDQYSFSVGRFNNIAVIPNAAIGRVEVLKEGGATTYGADAVGGVINYITRRNLDGVEMAANYRQIQGSDGDYDISISGGKLFENGNIMGVVSFTHRSELDLSERDWTFRDYLENPSAWSGSGSPGAYIVQTQNANSTGLTTPGVYTSITPGSSALTAGGSGSANVTCTGVGAPLPSCTGVGVIVPGFNRFVGNTAIGASGLVRDPSCAALGGFNGFSSTPSPVCYWQFNRSQNAVEEQSTLQAYLEANYEFNDYLKFHAEFMVYKLDIPRIPIDNAGALINNSPMLTTLTAPATTYANFQLAATNAYQTPGTNPAVAQFLTLIKNSDGTPAFTAAQIAAITNPAAPGRIGLLSSTWRPFTLGENPAGPDFQHNFNTQYRYTVDFSGDIPEFWGNKLTWEAAFTLTTNDYNIEARDMLVDRLQAALNGLGGPSCTGSTPGANNCMWLNPFATSVQSNQYTGETNPLYVNTGTYSGYTPGQGLTNNAALVQWLYVPVGMHRTSEYTVFDFVVSGETNLRLWAERPIALAVGGQYRRFHEVVDLTDFADRTVNPCATPGRQDCTNKTGPLVYSRGANLTGFSFDSNRTYPVLSYFGELQIPIFDTLNAQISGRYEKFFSDISPIDNDVFVMSGALKWQVADWIALRATAGQTFSQVNPPAPADPTVATNGTPPAAFGGAGALYTFTTLNYPNLDVQPETGFNYNIGALIDLGNFRATIDYYNIQIDNIVRAQTTAQLITALVVPGQTTPKNDALINCSSPLLTEAQPLLGNQPYITLNGACVQGTSVLNGAAGTGSLRSATVRFFGTQGGVAALVNGGTLETSGIDVSASYRWDDFFGGRLDISTDWSYILEYRQTDFIVYGITVASGFDGIGSFNEDTGKNSQHVAQYRGSLTFNWAIGNHNFNLTTRVVSSFVDDVATNYLESPQFNANVGNASGVVDMACADTNLTAPPNPAGTGTGVYGSQTGAAVTGVIGYCAGQNVTITAGQKIPVTFNTDFTYRVILPWQTTATFTISNVFDQDPPFARRIISYDAFVGSPLGRTFRFGITKKW